MYLRYQSLFGKETVANQLHGAKMGQFSPLFLMRFYNKIKIGYLQNKYSVLIYYKHMKNVRQTKKNLLKYT